MPKFKSWGHEIVRWRRSLGHCDKKGCFEPAVYYIAYKGRAHTLSGERLINHSVCIKHAEAFAKKYGLEMP